MLDPWIIEEILRREEEQRRREEESRRIEMPLEYPRYRDSEPARPSGDGDTGGRGVIVIDI